jgi:phage gp36-like protein
MSYAQDQYLPREPEKKAPFRDEFEEAIDHLKHIEAFQLFAAEIEALCERAIDDLETVPPQLLERECGKIAAYRSILSLM